MEVPIGTGSGTISFGHYGRQGKWHASEDTSAGQAKRTMSRHAERAARAAAAEEAALEAEEHFHFERVVGSFTGYEAAVAADARRTERWLSRRLASGSQISRVQQ